MSNLSNTLAKIDWKLLREQKDYLINEADNWNDSAPNVYDGVVNLIDAIQDNAIADGLATEREVFGPVEYDPISIGATAANIMDGVHLVARSQQAMETLLEHWEQGFLELTQFFAEMAVYSEDQLRRRVDQDFPGVYDYEVSCRFGEWFAVQTLSTPLPPTLIECKVKWFKLMEAFFAQRILKE